MNLICYPNNQVTTEDEPLKTIGTNETFGIPAERPYKYLDVDGVELFSVGGDTIKAFYNRRPDGFPETRGMKGIPKSDETKERIRQAKLKRSTDKRRERVQQRKSNMMKAIHLLVEEVK